LAEASSVRCSFVECGLEVAVHVASKVRRGVLDDAGEPEALATCWGCNRGALVRGFNLAMDVQMNPLTRSDAVTTELGQQLGRVLGDRQVPIVSGTHDHQSIGWSDPSYSALALEHYGISTF
jgi:hypothetical protein